MSAAPFEAGAAQGVSFVERRWNADADQVESETKTCDDPVRISSLGDSQGVSMTGGCFFLDGDIAAQDALLIGGDCEIDGNVLAYGDLTLGWTALFDMIKAESYTPYGAFGIAEGKKLTDGDAVYSGAYTYNDRDLFAGKRLTHSLTDWESVQYQIDTTDDGYVGLPKEVSALPGEPALVIPEGKIILFNLNGHTMDRALDAAAENGSGMLVYSPITYCIKAQSSDNRKLVNVTRALYNYHLAAKAYFP